MSSNVFPVSSDDFSQIPGSPIVYWLSDAMRKTFTMGKPLEEVTKPRQGLATADNNASFASGGRSASLAVHFTVSLTKKLPPMASAGFRVIREVPSVDGTGTMKNSSTGKMMD